MNDTGLLIAIEGIDGSGKSTLTRMLAQELTNQNYRVVLTKEPGDTLLGKQIRSMVQQQPVPTCPKAEYLLFVADRAQHAQEVILPACNEGAIIISDRMGDSSIVYQGYARGLDIDMIQRVNAWALCNRMPDVTIFVKLDPEIARQRWLARKTALSAFEKEHATFMHKVHAGFCALYKNRDDVIIIAGENNEQRVLKETCSALMPWLITYEKRDNRSSSTLARQP